MKIVLICDTHFGARNDSQVFSDYIREFYEGQFFPYLKDNKITQVIHLGDVFDRRKYINFKTLVDFEKMFMNNIYKQKIDLTLLTGNHDVFYKNTNKVNSLELLLREGLHQNLDILNATNTRRFYNDFINDRQDFTEILLVPWINEENHDDTMNMIKNTDVDIVLGHLELSGFPMYKGMPQNVGMKSKAFKRFDLVCSGHFHHRSSKKNIHYLGCPYQITWADWDDPKGFHVLDTDTKKIEFIENPLKLFIKVKYDDTKTNYDLESVDSYKDKYVKLIVDKKDNIVMYDKFVTRLYDINPANLIILDDLDEYSVRYSEDEDVTLEDTTKFISKYVDDMTEFNTIQKKELDARLRDTYIKALEIDDNVS